MPRAYRMAAIDVGTNSIHMIVVESRRHGYRVIDKEKQMVQLGRDSLEGRPLTAEAVERGVSTLRTMAEIARRWNVDDIVAVATSAVREAPNRRRFLSAADQSAGIKVRVISEEEEADYIYRAVRSAVDFHGGTALTVDIGGGSVELIVGTAEEVFYTHSEPLGALRLAQKFGLEGKTDDRTLEKCRKAVRKSLKKAMARIASLGFDFIIGTSGTIMTLAVIAAEPDEGDTVSSGLRWLSRSRLGALIDQLAALDLDERANVFSLDARRASTLLAGAVVLEQIMDALEIEHLRACDAALREGVVEQMLERWRQDGNGAAGSSAGSVRRASVMDLAERSHVDRAHAAHVARLALRMFDQSQELHMLRTGERTLLEYAALLHEVGTHVSFQKHHEHSYYVISHAGLRGFTADQVSIIANVARYHRKSLPQSDHEGFTQLSPAQREVVQKLTAILRMADALDRGRRGAVRDVGVQVGAKRVRLKLRLRDHAGVELEAAQKKRKYFARVFDRKVELEVVAR